MTPVTESDLRSLLKLAQAQELAVRNRTGGNYVDWARDITFIRGALWFLESWIAVFVQARRLAN